MKRNSMYKELEVKVGDMLIPNDEFISYTGTKEFEVLEIKEFKNPFADIQYPGSASYDITLGGIVPIIGSIYGDFREYRTLKTINHKINPELHVDKDWNLHGKYCKAIFFTSEDKKKEWQEKFNERKMNQYLFMARQYGYKG